MTLLSTFLTANPGLRLETADLFSEAALAGYNWPDGSRKDLLQSLRTRQRMLKVYPDNNVAEVLETLGFHSAHHIAATDNAEFAQKATPALSALEGITDANALCAQISANAARIRRASFELALARPRTVTLAVTDTPAAANQPDFQAGVPDYERLFGPMITCDCDDCQSIFGPAAYFTDLMRVVTDYVTPPLEQLFTLQYRRPDLWTLPLDCGTAGTELAYIDIVNAILQQNIATNYAGGNDPLELIAAAPYPFSAPFNQSFLTIRKGMEELQTGLASLYKTLDNTAPATAAALLDLSPEQLSMVNGTTVTTLAQLYGFHDAAATDADLLAALGQQRVFLRQTGLTPDALEALLYQNLEDNANLLLPLFFLNGVLSSGQYLDLRDADLVNREPAALVVTDGTTDSALTDNILKQLAVYIRLKAQHNWSYEELDWLLRSAALSLNPDAPVNTVDDSLIEVLGAAAAIQKVYDIPADELSAFWYDMKTYGGETPGAAQQNLWDRVYNTPPLMANSTDTTQPAYYRPVYDGNPVFASTVITWTLTGTQTTEDLRLNSQLAGALQVSGTDLTALLAAIAPGAVSVKLEVPFMSMMYRVARMARMLGMSVPDLTLMASLLDLPMTAAWSLEQVETLIETAEWLQHANLTVSQLSYQVTGVLPTGAIPLSDAAAFDKALTDMLQSSRQARLDENSFNTDTLDAPTSQAIFTQLVASKVLTPDGIVTNAVPLTPKHIGAILYNGEVTGPALFKINPQQKLIAFGAAGGQGNVTFPFYPFADPAIIAGNSFTISLWGQVNEISTEGWPMFVGNRDVWYPYDMPPGVLLCSINEAPAPGSIRVEEGYNDIHYSGTVPGIFTANNQWAFISWVNDSGNWRLYCNGEEVGMGKMPQEVPAIYQLPGSQTVAYYAGYGFNGYVANVSIWTTARTGEQIMQDMYTAFTGSEDGLLAYWPMNEGTGTTINNYSPRGAAYNGTFYNGSNVGTPVWVDVPDLPSASEVLVIWQTLMNALTAQETLVIKTLAGAARMSAQQMAGISRLSSQEVNNATALGFEDSTPYPYLANFLLVTAPDNNPQRTAYLDTLFRNTALARALRLNGKEMTAIVALPDAFGTGNISYDDTLLSITQLQTITAYKSLLAYCNNSEGLLLYFILAQLPENLTVPQLPGILERLPGKMFGQYVDTLKTWLGNPTGYLASLTGWNADEISAITSQAYFSMVDFTTVAGIRKLAAVFVQEEKLGMNIASLNLLRGLSADNLFTSTDSWQNYLAAAAAINGALSSKRGSAAIEKVRADLAAQTRNVLADWLIWELGGDIDGVTNEDQLYEYLLIDVNMSPSVKISWMVAGMNSLQLYVNRCINNMEPGVVNQIPNSWWEWMSTYRVWQANREVYLYPENYVDPSLRKFQSPQFKTFVNDISKGQITDNNVKQALASYLEAVNEVASLEIVDGYVARMQKGGPGLQDDNDKHSLFIVGRSRTAPYSFYTRVAVALTSKDAVEDGTPPSDATNMSFGPWEKISLQISAPYVSTIAAFGRQFIFWVEQTTVVNTTASDQKYTTVYGSIYYSYRDFSATWIAPVILRKDIIIAVYGSGLPHTNYYETDLLGARMGDTASQQQYAFYKTLPWNKPRLQFVPGSAGIADSILVQLGDIVGWNPAITSAPVQPSTSAMTDEQRTFQNQIYTAAKLAYSNQSDYFSILRASVLFSSLRTQEVNAGINTHAYLLLDGWLEQTDHQTQLSFAASASLISPPLPVKTSWWPGIDNYGLVKGTTVKDVVGGSNGSSSNNFTFKQNVFPAMPNAAVASFTTGSWYNFIWTVNESAANSTFSCWLNVQSIASGGSILMGFPLMSSNAILRIKECFIYNGYLYIFYTPANSSSTTNVCLPISLNTWYFLTITTSSSGIKVYLNGVAQQAGYAPLNISAATFSQMQFGRFNGYALGFQYWDITLTAAQVLLAYQTSLTPYLSGMDYANTSLYRLGNSAGAFAFNTGNQSYLVLPDIATKTIAECIQSSYHEDSATLILSFQRSPLLDSTANFPMRFVRMNTDTLPDLITLLAANGINALYAREVQYLPEQDLNDYMPSPLVTLPAMDSMNFNGAFGMYFWELFFYAPYLIAEKLRAGNKYAAAEKWFRYIFDPASSQPPTVEKLYDFLFNTDSNTGPVAIWPMNRSSNNQFIDLKNQLPVTFNTLTEAAGQQPPFSKFDRAIWTFGPSSTATSPYNASLNTAEMTITAWVRLTSMPSSATYITIVNSQTANTGYHLAFHYNSSAKNWTLRLLIQGQSNGGPTGWVSADSYPLDTLNEWQFVAGRYDGKTLKVYINGKHVTQNTARITHYIHNTTGTFRIGCGSAGSVNEFYFNGQIADVAVFGYAMRGADIERLYQNYISVGPNALYWNFRPFQRINAETLYHILNGDAWQENFLQPAEYYTASLQMAVYEYDPFDPDTIARLRINSWQKATFMRYVENLLNWGDSLFTQDTWETLSDATMRYVMAASLLGRIPVKEVSEAPEPAVNYADIEDAYGAGNVPPFLIEMENQLAGIGPDATLEQQVQSIVDAYFCVPANKQLLQYWDLVADRLFKLRHGLTIGGTPNHIPLYAPAIDPAALVAAAETGDLGNASAVSIPAVPAFRFSYMIAQAKAVTSEVVRLGAELQAALEKQDGEQLARMQAGYQEVLYNMTADIRASQVNQLQYVEAGLQASYDNAAYLHNTYNKWLRTPVNFLEAASLELGALAIDLNLVTTDIDALAGIAFLLPNIFGLADGGMDFGHATESEGKALQSLAHISGLTGQLAAQMAQYVRREQEWGLQATVAGNQMQEISAQITANSFALQAARQEASLNQAQLQQAQEVYQFLTNKFTNEALYSWLSGQLSGLYSQLFQLAWTLAQQTQTALQYELNLTHTYLSNAAWNAAYQGLLGGDALLLALQQMENAYISGNNRKLEIRKTWSMRQNNPQALLTLLATGSCYFDLNELSYELDFPAHYNRKIRSLSVTIPAVVGPYQDLHATLVQTGNTVMIRPSVTAAQYLTGITTTPPSDGSLRMNWNPNQEIIISTGINDAGVFQLNFNDEQYLPFEGTGAVSSWYLSIPQAANAFPLRSISDVIFTIDYTAEDGGSAYAAQITALPPLTDYKGYQYLSLRQLYSAAWFNFCNNTVVTGSGTTQEVASSLSFELVTAMYPANLANVKLGNSAGQVGLFLATETGISADGLTLQLNSGEETVWPLPDYLIRNGTATGPVTVPGKGAPWVLQAADIPASLLTTGNLIDPAKLLDIILVVPFSGTLSW
ncbi:hypothetical protein F0L74_20390 [Chitinophaga agrisoli]|uniref:Concanavalin A-like lectin/glucanase superfamily protein n=1 Tax=Chitinophaga agrisoli TaxID=2607653 RepID=A0A5B2VI50_9BACT|nr:LamG-like jellyroll fold domain-containing protein [Chitinophaga agrisoli]KAA2238585.1 hypothetical protein F0L74_20390 [Chitinophaga agrisoli]